MAAESSLHTQAARQEAYVIFQTVTRDYTTFLTQVTLGSQPTDAPPPPTRNHESATGLTDAEIGAVIGSVLGFFFLVLIICCCCFRRRPVKVMKVKSVRNSYSSSYIVDESKPPPPPVAPRVMRQEFFYRPMWTPRQPGAQPYQQPYQPPPSPYSPSSASTPYQPPAGTPFRAPATPFQAPPTPVQYPPAAAQCIPGGPKVPLYRALPIPNPRRPANIARDMK